MYTDFAAVYDRLMQEVDYKAFALVYDSILQNHGVYHNSSIVECACGTGNISIPLSENYNLTGIDISEEMLSRAMQKARQAGKRITFIRQDMQQLKLHKPTQAVLATCDGPNYLSSLGLKHFFEAAYAGLLPNGIICFDISSEYKLRNTIADNTFTLSDEDICYIWQNKLDKDSVSMQLDIFVKNKGFYDRLIEYQQQYIHSAKNIISALENAGFTNISVFNKDLDPPKEKDERLFFVASKKENYVRHTI
ncbi:MAG: class I SAM-dependent methyltransferase [Eubacteriales bacterium]|nr:class I SAM-dependent methyltransferase [Eubacteriales bacterium]